MTTFLLVVSLLLNGVAIFAIIVLFTRQNRLFEVEKRQEKWSKEVEEIISSSLLEMKEENEAFIHRFQTLSSQSITSVPTKLLNEEIINKPPSADPLRTEMLNKTGKVLKKHAVKAYQNSPVPLSKNENTSIEHINDAEINKDISDIPSGKNAELTKDEIFRDLLVNQVQILQQQGFSTEDIAKKLGKGKTEIELLLKFSRNK